MPHPIRSRRNANLARRRAAAEKQKPKVGEAAWWGVQAAAITRRYPVPPKYRYSHDERQPSQPAAGSAATVARAERTPTGRLFDRLPNASGRRYRRRTAVGCGPPRPAKADTASSGCHEVRRSSPLATRMSWPSVSRPMTCSSATPATTGCACGQITFFSARTATTHKMPFARGGSAPATGIPREPARRRSGGASGAQRRS